MKVASYRSTCASPQCRLDGRILVNDQIIRTSRGWEHPGCVNERNTNWDRLLRTESIDTRVTSNHRTLMNHWAKLSELEEKVTALTQKVEAQSTVTIPAFKFPLDEVIEKDLEQRGEIDRERNRAVIKESLATIRKRTGSERVQRECEVIEAALHQLTGD